MAIDAIQEHHLLAFVILLALGGDLYVAREHAPLLQHSLCACVAACVVWSLIVAIQRRGRPYKVDRFRNAPPGESLLSLAPFFFYSLWATCGSENESVYVSNVVSSLCITTLSLALRPFYLIRRHTHTKASLPVPELCIWVAAITCDIFKIHDWFPWGANILACAESVALSLSTYSLLCYTGYIKSFTPLEYGLVLQMAAFALSSCWSLGRREQLSPIGTSYISFTVFFVLLAILEALGLTKFRLQASAFQNNTRQTDVRSAIAIVFAAIAAFLALPISLKWPTIIESLAQALLVPSMSRKLFFYWLLTLMFFAVCFWAFQSFFFSQLHTHIRKYFHLLALVLFLPGFAIRPKWTSFAILHMLYIFFGCEFLRIARVSPFDSLLQRFMGPFLDEKDRGPIVLTHVYLLMGCILPCVFMEKPSTFLLSSGTLVLGVGDSAASIVGSMYGSTHWLSTSKKSVAGTLAMSVALCFVLHFYGVFSWWTAIITILVSIFEGLLTQVDNLVLPVLYCALMALSDA